MRLIDADKITDNEIASYLGVGYVDCTDAVKYLIDDQPTVEVSQWILCKEGSMPEDILDRRKNAFLYSVHSVLATGRYHNGSDLCVQEVNRYEDENNVWHWSRPFVEIIAWMPLPEPYKKEV